LSQLPRSFLDNIFTSVRSFQGHSIAKMSHLHVISVCHIITKTQAQIEENVTKQGPKIMNLVQYLHKIATIEVMSGHTKSFKVTKVKEHKSFKLSTAFTSTNPVTNIKMAIAFR